MTRVKVGLLNKKRGNFKMQEMINYKKNSNIWVSTTLKFTASSRPGLLWVSYMWWRFVANLIPLDSHVQTK